MSRFKSAGLPLLAALAAFALVMTAYPPPRIARAQEVAAASLDAGTPDAKAAALAAVQQMVAHPDAPVDFLSLSSIALTMYNEGAHKDFSWPIGLLLILVAYPLFRFVKPRVPFFSTKLGGALLTMIVSVCGAIGTALVGVGSGAVTFALILKAVQVGGVSSAVFTFAKLALQEVAPKVHDALFPATEPAPAVAA